LSRVSIYWWLKLKLFTCYNQTIRMSNISDNCIIILPNARCDHHAHTHTHTHAHTHNAMVAEWCSRPNLKAYIIIRFDHCYFGGAHVPRALSVALGDYLILLVLMSKALCPLHRHRCQRVSYLSGQLITRMFSSALPRIKT